MNILITGAWRGAEKHFDRISAMGHEVSFMQWETDPLPCAPGWVEGVVGNGFFLFHEISAFPNLRFIQLTSAGFDRVPMAYIEERGITIKNARGVYSIPMAEYAVAGVLCLYKEIPSFLRHQAERRWEKIRGLTELSGKNVLIVGCGSVGTECAKRFRAFGCRVDGVDLIPRRDPDYYSMSKTDLLDALLPAADILVLTVPLCAETENLMDRGRLLLLKEDAVIVNIARGGVLDLDSFTALKKEGRALRAVLDVFPDEPLPPDHPVWDMDGVIITPHNSFAGENNDERLNRVILENLREAM